MTTPTPSLVDLASTKALPKIQFMDQSTVDWMLEHRPNFQTNKRPEIDPQLWAFALELKLNPDWLENPEMVGSLHGLRHGLRVGVYGAILATQANLSPEEQRAMVVACALHDMRRQDDQGDEGHGQRTADWFDKHREQILAELGVLFSAELLTRASIAIHLHDIPYGEFSDADKLLYEQAKTETDIVKAADALDRYRMPKMKWWPDTSHLKLIPAEDLMAFAFDLTATSEANFLETGNNHKSVKQALISIGENNGRS